MKSIPYLLLTASIGFSSYCYAGEKINESLSAAGVTVVNIENLSGKVTVIGTNDDEVSVKGELGDDVKRFIFEKRDNMILAKVDNDQDHRHYRNNEDDASIFTVKMPKDIQVNFEGVSSDVDISSIIGSVEVKTVSGDIKAENLKDRIDITTVSGNIDSEDLTGKVRLSSVSGSIDDRNSAGRLTLKSVSGNVKTQSSAKEVTLGSVSGGVDFKLGKVEELTISNVSGDVDGSLTLLDNGQLKASGVSSDITLNFQDNLNAEFRLSASAGGDLVNKITSDKAKRAKYGPSSKLNFSAGNGSASVRGSVVSGEIKVTSR